MVYIIIIIFIFVIVGIIVAGIVEHYKQKRFWREWCQFKTKQMEAHIKFLEAIKDENQG